MQESQPGRTFTGVDWRGIRKPPLVPGDAIRFSDLRGCDFEGCDLQSTEIVGCRLNGVSFRNARLTNASLVGCFAADDGPPVDLRGRPAGELRVIESHLHCITDPSQEVIALGWRWPAALSNAARRTLAERND